MNLLLKKQNKFIFSMKKNINPNRTQHKKQLKEVRAVRLEKQLKSNILKRKKASKING